MAQNSRAFVLGTRNRKANESNVVSIVCQRLSVGKNRPWREHCYKKGAILSRTIVIWNQCTISNTLVVSYSNNTKLSVVVNSLLFVQQLLLLQYSVALLWTRLGSVLWLAAVLLRLCLTLLLPSLRPDIVREEMGTANLWNVACEIMSCKEGRQTVTVYVHLIDCCSLIGDPKCY